MSTFLTRVNFIRRRIRKCGVFTRRIQVAVRHLASRFLLLCRLTDMTLNTRIEPLPPQRANWLIRAMYRYTKRRFGEVPEPFAVVAHHPRLLVAYAIHETMLQSASRKLPTTVRELAVLWTARTVGCSWCVDFGSMLLRLDGLDVERIKDIENYATSPRFTDDERAAIAYADAMTTDPHNVTDEQVADLRTRFGENGVVELTYQIGTENMRARMNTALGITEQGFNSGDACRIPWLTEPRDANETAAQG
jgi:AhpD family alkylhydroperoxidase